MYGLLHIGTLFQELLEKLINTKGYIQITLITGLWTYAWRTISFTLCMDYFGVKVLAKNM